MSATSSSPPHSNEKKLTVLTRKGFRDYLTAHLPASKNLNCDAMAQAVAGNLSVELDKYVAGAEGEPRVDSITFNTRRIPEEKRTVMSGCDEESPDLSFHGLLAKIHFAKRDKPDTITLPPVPVPKKYPSAWLNMGMKLEHHLVETANCSRTSVQRLIQNLNFQEHWADQSVPVISFTDRGASVHVDLEKSYVFALNETSTMWHLELGIEGPSDAASRSSKMTRIPSLANTAVSDVHWSTLSFSLGLHGKLYDIECAVTPGSRASFLELGLNSPIIGTQVSSLQ